MRPRHFRGRSVPDPFVTRTYKSRSRPPTGNHLNNQGAHVIMWQHFVIWRHQRLIRKATAALEAGDRERAEQLVDQANKWAARIRG